MARPVIEAKTIEVGLERSYPVVVGAGLDIAPCLPESVQPGACAILTDSAVSGLHLGDVSRNLRDAGWDISVVVTVEAGEKSKSLDVYGAAMRELARCGLSRDATLFALGGGVVGDLGGFVAATYMRGIRLVMLPTTLLAMVDSSVGGKTGVDLAEGKNLVGAFHQPEAVIADLDWLSTLGDDQLSSGLAEVVKMGLLAGGGFYADLSGVAAARNRDLESLFDLVSHSVIFKARVVAEDERESGLRAILNYGHTIGHAIEAATSYGTAHGVAVALGMRCAASLSEAKLGFSASDDQSRFIEDAGLPRSIPDLDSSEIIACMGRDKKRLSTDSASRHRFVLLEDVGVPRWGIPVTDDEVAGALSVILGKGESA